MPERRQSPCDCGEGRSIVSRKKRRPSGRDCVLAGAALSSLKERERHERKIMASAAPMIAPVVAMWRDAQQSGIRLINLERRARFARLES
ncbi:hypothetical protein JJT62_09380 [Methylocystis sp. Sn-Cys]|nr:hypothetical protein [Methylocystis sp. Sn-Cys]